MAKWSTTETTKGGEALWLTRLGVLTVNSVRQYGLPSGNKTLQVQIPTMKALADGLYNASNNDLTAIKPSDQPQFVDAVDDI